MALEIKSHGGSCCGVRHIRNFSQVSRYDWRTDRNVPPEPITVERIEAIINGKKDENGRYEVQPLISPRPGPLDNNGGRSRGKVVEAIITDSQFRADPTLAQTMKDAGFKLVTRFSNNTGGMCNILHRVTGGRDIQQAARRNAHIRTLIS